MERINFDIKWTQNGWFIKDRDTNKEYVCEKSEKDTFFATERLPAVLDRILADRKEEN